MDPTSPRRDENGEAGNGRVAVEMVIVGEGEGEEEGGREKGLTVVTLLQQTFFPFDVCAPPHSGPVAACDGVADHEITSDVVSVVYDLVVLRRVL